MQTKEAALAFGALAAETRVDVLRRLVAAGGDGLRSGDLAAALGVSAPNMSFHLKELQHCGLIAASREGREVRYRADFGGIRAVIEYLLADCCNGDPRLCGPYVVTPRKAD
jgi:DNA-binding transcriptional ArsR family regulator